MSDKKLEIIVNTFKDSFEKVILMDKSMAEDQKTLRNVVLSVRKKKEDNPELKAIEVKEELQLFDKVGYELGLKDQDLRKYVNMTVEYYTLCMLLGLDVELDDQRKSTIDAMVANSHNLYTVNKGEIVIANEELYEYLTAGMKTLKDNEEHLDRIFNSPAFTE
jgi:hypothetical protein